MTGPDVLPDGWFFKAEDRDSQKDKPNEAHYVSSSCDGIEGDEAQLHCWDSGHGHCQQRPQGHSSSTASYKGCKQHPTMSVLASCGLQYSTNQITFCVLRVYEDRQCLGKWNWVKHESRSCCGCASSSAYGWMHLKTVCDCPDAKSMQQTRQ